MATSASTDSTTAPPCSSTFINNQLVQSFPHYDIVKLNESNFVQWRQHIQLSTDGYNLTGFLDGTLSAPPRFVQSQDGALLTATHLIAAVSSAKFFRIRHELYLIKKGAMPIKDYIAKIQKTCALIDAAGSLILETEKAEIVLARLPSNLME
ncbi:hypothetical protein PVK06_001069 [Gossypium arboreum]|uniref:Retrotransposon Copia-like N-terminal domain-containing protein n=1 Tax=Gossypium arboreum TaxID=29729 RepID=A0ABR0R102_GOSAR|nr:hypothetical protein PVK06_001069 [Gossypium arboreum]